MDNDEPIDGFESFAVFRNELAQPSEDELETLLAAAKQNGMRMNKAASTRRSALVALVLGGVIIGSSSLLFRSDQTSEVSGHPSSTLSSRKSSIATSYPSTTNTTRNSTVTSIGSTTTAQVNTTKTNPITGTTTTKGSNATTTTSTTAPLDTYTMFGNQTPAKIAATDAKAVELGVKFTSDASGYVEGIRFYKSTTNTGTHTGSLWTLDGTKLANVTFTGESASGWQTAMFASPVPISAGTTYIASYHTNTGHYSCDENGFDSQVDSPPLHALANGSSGNGVFRYGTSAFPDQTYIASNYWVDVVFEK